MSSSSYEYGDGAESRTADPPDAPPPAKAGDDNEAEAASASVGAVAPDGAASPVFLWGADEALAASSFLMERRRASAWSDARLNSATRSLGMLPSAAVGLGIRLPLLCPERSLESMAMAARRRKGKAGEGRG
jgi:hypothetical protein